MSHVNTPVATGSTKTFQHFQACIRCSVQAGTPSGVVCTVLVALEGRSICSGNFLNPVAVILKTLPVVKDASVPIVVGTVGALVVTEMSNQNPCTLFRSVILGGWRSLVGDHHRESAITDEAEHATRPLDEEL